jgi:uncharacterized membrane protein YgcG
LSVPADFLIFLGIVAVLWIAYRAVKYGRERSKPSRGDANAYDGDLLPPGENYHPSGGKHVARGGVHTAHGGVHGGGHTGHTGHTGGFSGHGGAGGGHH